MRHKMSYLFLIILLAALCGYSEPAQAESSKPLLYYFYENYCDSCHPDQDFMQEFTDLTGKSISDYQYLPYNVRYEDNKALFEQIAQEFEIPEEEQLLPMAIVDGTVYAGSAAISRDLSINFTQQANSTDSVLYYLYVTACSSCAQAAEAIDSLPETIEVTRGQHTFESKIVVHRININEQPEVAKALFEKYFVPESRQTAPIVFLANTYLSDSESIARSLNFALQRGSAVGTELISEEAVTPIDSGAFSYLGTIAAGFVGGLNPCALSMLLFFLMLILQFKKNPWKYALTFLGGKLLAYLAIGTVLLTVFQMWNPTWLSTAIKILLTVMAAILIVLNLNDFFAARSEKYGKIRNQLPVGLRKFNHDTIRGVFERHPRHLTVYMLLLGILVAAGEFLCAGQVYLATLLAALQSGAQPLRMGLMLVCYCVSFLTPALILCALVARGRSVMDLSEWMRRHMDKVKLITALFFVLLVVVVWLL